MRTYKSLLLGLILTCATSSMRAQGTFQNLDFESANLVPTPPGQAGGPVPVADAIPSWTVYTGTNPVVTVLYNDLTIGSASVDILDPNWAPGDVIEGRYAVVLQAGAFGPDASIVQTGLIPVSANSVQLKILFVTGSSFTQFGLAVGGHDIALIPLLTAGNYTLYGGDISAFAGQMQELRIAAIPTPTFPFSSVGVDSIVFSPQVVPEPGTIGLFALGGLLLIRQCRRS